MDLQPRLTTRLEQGMALLPKMLQSIEVLQLTSADLLALIDRELTQNETLVAEPPAMDAAVDAAMDAAMDGSDVGASDGAAERAEPDSFEAFESFQTRPAAGREDQLQAFLNNVPGAGETLTDHVVGQLGWLDLPDSIIQGVSALAECLDERGLLADSDEELRNVLDQVSLDRCLEVLQSLEPRGIGARGPIDAMLLQLSPDDPDLGDIRAMLTEHLELLAKNKLPEVSRALGRQVGEVQDLLLRIKRLEPHPGKGFASEVGSEVVHPDVTVRLVGGCIEIEIDNMILPDLGILPDYQDMATDRRVDRDTRSYLRGKLRSARELIHAVEQRKRTLGRVTLAIMNHQSEFLAQGSLAVRSLCMSRISAEVGLHPSTVSRAIAGKFVQTDHGIFRLRDFFDGDRRSTPTTGAPVRGRMAIKDHVRDLIGNEDRAAPWSDDELVRRLAVRNIVVARRTVAKYRKELGLPSSWRRKNHEGGE